MSRLFRYGMLPLLGLLILQTAQAKLPFVEEFNGPLDPAIWKISDGKWEVKDGALYASNSDRARGANDPLSGWPFGTFDYVVAMDVGTNMTVTVDATPIKMGDTFNEEGAVLDGGRVFRRMGLMVHSNGAAQFADKKWALLYGLMGGTEAGLAHLEEAVAWRVQDPSIVLEMGKTYTFKMEVKGSHVKSKVWEKGTTEPDWMLEDDFVGQLTSNGVGLLGVGFDVKYDNLRAEPLAAEPGTISGTVVDESDKPVEGVSLTNGEVTATTDAAGKFSMKVVPGIVGLVASKAGYITMESAGIDVAEGGTTSDVSLVLKKEKLPLKVDFNGPEQLEWLFPTSADFNGEWTFEDGALIARNSTLIEPGVGGALPAQGLYDFTYLPDVGSDIIATVKVTPLAFNSEAGFARIGLATHFLGGTGGGNEKKWMLLYGILDVDAEKPFGLGLLEEGVHWGPLSKETKLEIGKTYVFKMATKGREVMGKVWENGTAEPADWTLRDSFSLNQIYAAGVGLLGVGADVRYDDLEVVANTGPVVTVVPGDLNGDTRINVQDATLSLRIAVGLLTPTDAQKAAGDVNKDGKWNIQDTTLILQVAVGNKPASDLK